MKQLKASSGVLTIGSPLTLNEVLTKIGHPVIFLNSSINLKKILALKKLSKINYISNGDDYQVLFTASKNKMRIIRKIINKR